MKIRCYHKFQGGIICNYEWYSRGDNLPVSCPSCKNRGKMIEVLDGGER